MNLFKRVVDFYIDFSIHIGIEVYALVQITLLSFGIPSNMILNGLVFFGTIIGYNFLKYVRSWRAILFRPTKYLALLLVNSIAAGAALFFFFELERQFQIRLVLIGFLVLVYPCLRQFGLWKLFMVSCSVALVTVYIPLIAAWPGDFAFGVAFFQRFVIIISLLIPFEISDSKSDAVTLNTIPQKFGIEASKVFGILLIIPFFIMEFLKVNPSYVVIPIGLLVALSILFASTKRSKYYTSFWVESIPIIWWLVLLLK